MAYLDENNNEIIEPEVNQVSGDEAPEIVVEEVEDEKVTKIKKGKKSKGANKVKATVSEYKKISWLSFPKVVKQTLVVLTVTVIFLVVIFGIDFLLNLLYDLLTKNI